MKHSIPFLSILLTTAACTQPAVMVEYRGSSDFGRSGSGYAGTTMSAPYSSVSSENTYVGAQPVYNADRAKESNWSSASSSNSSIGVSDLEPAAGGNSTVSSKPISLSQGFSSTVQPFGSPNSASKPVEIDHYDADLESSNTTTIQSTTTAASKEVVLNTPNEAAPVNAWTNKARDKEKFVSDATSSKASSGNAQYIWPVSSKDVSSTSDGINISAKEGEPVWAAADGEIVYADSKMKGYGNMVLVKHHGGKTTTYAHLARISVDKYDRVKQGDIIGYVGKTGNVKKSQLFFSMKDGSKTVDPQKYLDRDVAGL